MTAAEQPKECKPCPFDPTCGVDSEVLRVRPDSWAVYCYGCGARGPETETKAEAVRLWNLAPRKEEP